MDKFSDTRYNLSCKFKDIYSIYSLANVKCFDLNIIT